MREEEEEEEEALFKSQLSWKGLDKTVQRAEESLGFPVDSSSDRAVFLLVPEQDMGFKSR